MLDAYFEKQFETNKEIMSEESHFSLNHNIFLIGLSLFSLSFINYI